MTFSGRSTGREVVILAKAKKEGRKKKVDMRSFHAFPHLLELKPREKYQFHSDYFEIDDGVAAVLSFFHVEGATDSFGPFWGVNMIPRNMPDGVSVLKFEQVRRMSDGWIDAHQNRAEGVAAMDSNEQEKAGTNKNRVKSRRRQQDLELIAQELSDGSSYLHATFRLLVKAPNLEVLDEAVSRIDRLYVDRFGTLSAAPYYGEQRKELTQLFGKNDRKEGKGFGFTSKEYAGSYALVTHGLEDASGEYVGQMVGDVNNSAILFDVDAYEHHICVAADSLAKCQTPMNLGRERGADMWGSKISQACLLSGGRVVHMILDGCNLNRLGPEFRGLTYRIDMNGGDVNMFEMFGKQEDELAIFPAQMQKLVLMAEQAYETTASDRSIIRTSLEEVATKFYIDNGMWRDNAGAYREFLRVVGIPHEDVPKLQMFVSYLDQEYNAIVKSDHKDPERLKAYSVLRGVFRNLLTSNGDLFNTTTTKKIDGAASGRRVIYDFSGLIPRGIGVAMAQFVNILGYAVGNLGNGDTVIIHGVDLITDGIKDYIEMQLMSLYDKGGRACFLYNNFEKMLKDKEFTRFDRADYTIFGHMSDTVVHEYQKLLGQDIPADLSRLITQRDDVIYYIRRGFDNVVFSADLSLGIQERGMRR